ncbi:MAG: extracellular solute-binding protein [Chloroflexi bacterium]|nr:extracellular solute-binding protein [Chloroflexota bacterium]
MWKLTVVVLVLLSMVFVVGCAGSFGGGPASAPGKGASTESWQQEWEKLKDDARSEGKLVVIVTVGPETRAALARAMKDKFGIELEFVAGRGDEIASRLISERKAEIFTADVYLGGAISALTLLKPAGLFESLDNVLLLPEISRKDLWWSGEIPFVDKQHSLIAFMAIAGQPITVNKDIVKGEDIRSWRDLLNPAWKGKMAMDDPTVPGKGNEVFAALAEGIMDMDFVKALGKQDLVITRDKRLHGEWVARGKYPIGIAVDDSVLKELQKAGAPLKNIVAMEGTFVTSTVGNVGQISKPPHPAASRVFVNWLLSKEGMAVFSKAFGFQTARVDIPTEHLNPDELRIPGGKYLNVISEEYMINKRKYTDIAKTEWASLLGK